MNKVRCHNGSALFIVMIALLLITMLFSAVILYGSYHQRLALQDTHDTKAYYLTESGIEVAVARLNESPAYSFSFTDSLASYGSFSVDIKPYGAYLLCQSIGKSGMREKTLRCLIGAVADDKFKNAINLGGQDYPLTLAGKTKIYGDVLVSPSGVLPGRFKGRRYGGDKLVFGEIRQSVGDRMPPYNSEVLDLFLDEMERIDFNSCLRFDKVFILDETTISQIDTNTELLFTTDLTINLDEKHLDMTGRRYKIRGNLNITGNSTIYGYGLFYVEGKVTLENQSRFKDAIVFSKEQITLEDNSEFGGQIIAEDNVNINDNAVLSRYAIVAGIGEIIDEEKCITINSIAAMSGTIISDYKRENINKPGQAKLLKTIDLNEQANLKGMIYNSGYSKISGSITGNISSNSFYIYDAPTMYINWLVDATVQASADIDIIPATFNGESGYDKLGGL